MYNIIKTTVTISMIQKNTVHNYLYTTNKKRKSCRQDHICLIVIQSTKFTVFSMLRQSCCCVSRLSRYEEYGAVLAASCNTTSCSTNDSLVLLCWFFVAWLFKLLLNRGCNGHFRRISGCNILEEITKCDIVGYIHVQYSMLHYWEATQN